MTEPTTTVKSLLLTDLVGSTRLVRALGDERAAELIGRCDRIARDLVSRHDGREIDKSDGFLIVFERPVDAVRFALEYHAALGRIGEDLGRSITARAAIHLGEVVLRENSPEDVSRGAKPVEVEGLAKHTVARLASLAEGRQTLLSRSAFDLARPAAIDRAAGGGENGNVRWLAHGAYVIDGIDEPIQVFEVGIAGFAPLAAPADSPKARRAVAAGEEATLGWRPAAGQSIPRRTNWVLEQQLGTGGFGEVWLARQRKTADRRVFKFCFQADHLRALRRELTIFRLLKAVLSERRDIARILDWQFDEPPYFLESEYTGAGNFIDWAARQGGLARVPLPTRLELVAQVAEALAAAHSVGVLHKDVKPGNVLVETDPHEGPRIRLTDFGIGVLQDARLALEQGITVHSATELVASDGSGGTSGTKLYLAPELVEGRAATVQADIYALGVLLYQVVVGDFRRALAPGWERDVEDELLREDIAAMVDGDPARRPASALEVAHALRELEKRRAQREDERREREQAEASRRALERAQLRRKQLVLIAGIALAVAFAISALALQTHQAREEAELRRGQAEELLGFMLGDLREKLEGVGRLDILDDVGDRAIEYFASLPSDELTETDLARGAETLLQIGDVRWDQGDLSAAARAYDTALEISRRLTVQDTANPDWQIGLGRAHARVGAALAAREDSDGALEHARAYLAISEELVARDTANLEFLAELASAMNPVAGARLSQSDLDGALEAFSTSVAILEDLVATQPDRDDWRRQLVDARGNEGRVLFVLGRPAEAVERFEANLEVQRSLLDADPDNASLLHGLLVTYNDLASTAEWMGELDAAIDSRMEEMEIARELLQRDPENTQWQNTLATAEWWLAMALNAVGETDIARSHAAAANQGYESLVARDSVRSQWQRSLGVTRVGIARMRLADGDVDGAFADARSALEILEARYQANPAERLNHEPLANAHILLGELWAETGDMQNARASWLRAAELLEPIAARGNDLLLLEPWFRVLVHLERTDEARGVAEALWDADYRHPRFLALARENGLLP